MPKTLSLAYSSTQAYLKRKSDPNVRGARLKAAAAAYPFADVNIAAARRMTDVDRCRSPCIIYAHVRSRVTSLSRARVLRIYSYSRARTASETRMKER